MSTTFSSPVAYFTRGLTTSFATGFQEDDVMPLAPSQRTLTEDVSPPFYARKMVGVVAMSLL